jgi:diaminohydroxyphosphoribosylaminopyrimidine deaminase / 5-amino-6-(5-phosphoribosylamino)uracil reductase
MVADPAADARFMERALFLAARGRSGASPNPMVGAVVVSPGGVVVGQGYHARAGEAHAEVVALDAARQRAAGATLYCTLEPCCHVGRTGPCVERIVAAGVSRVVAPMADPNPRVSGAGFAYLRAHGLVVAEGEGAREARRLNAPFVTWMTRHRPFVTVKTVVSADGFVGRTTGRVPLTGAAADRFFHRQRAEVDAIAVGANTVLVDDPLLTPRLVYRSRPLVRVIFDWRMRVSASARVFSTLPEGPVIMVVSAREAHSRPDVAMRLRDAGAELERLDTRDLGVALEQLAARDIVSLLVEAGPSLHAAFAEADLIDRLQRVRTPVRLGAGVPALPMAHDARLPAAAVRETVLGEDVLVETDVHGTD